MLELSSLQPIRKMAKESGIVHDLCAKIEIHKGTMKTFETVDLINVPRKEIV